jgi:hypothetical protein
MFRFINLIFLCIKKKFKSNFKIYRFDNIVVDVVIPTISKDYDLLKMVVRSTKNLSQRVNKIYIVSNDNLQIKSFCKENNCVFIDENLVLGYEKSDISYVVGAVDRSGWIFQQLLKLSAGEFVEVENYLVIDSDAILVSENSFMEDGKFVFFQNVEWHEPYFKSFKELFGYKAKNTLSFTSHMMIFNKLLLCEMKKELESRHHIIWDKVYLSTISCKETSCVSDYDTYANWVMYNYPDRMVEKPLYNKALSRKYLKNLNDLEKKYGSDYKTISFHSYIK